MKKQYRTHFLVSIYLLMLFPYSGFSQNLVGMWTGKIYTSEKTLPYEVAISEKDGKLSGYSYTTFNVKGEEMVAMKSIVVLQDGKGNIVIEDQDLVFNSFDEESPKQLKQTNTLKLEIVNDKTMLLLGTFKTLKTKQFRSMTGGIRLRKDSIIEQPKLVAKLDEMDLSKSLTFLPAKEEPQTAVAVIEKVNTEVEKTKTEEKIINAPATAKASSPKVNPVTTPIKSNNAAPVVTKPAPTVAKPPVAANTPPKPVVKPPVTAAKPSPAPPPVTAAATPPLAPKPELKKAPSRPLTAFLGDRAIENIQTVAYKSDSLTLTLYDNGEVDGDTVSIILNGKTIISKQGLSTKPITKTIYMTPDMGDSSQLIMYAESLGSIPPNTGLLIVKDGRDRYEIRFSGDLKKNAAVILKRKEEN